MRHLFLLFFALFFIGAGVFFFYEGPDFFNKKQSTVSSQSKTGEVMGVSDAKAAPNVPVSFESRADAAQFLPYKKPDFFNIAVSSAHAAIVMDVDSGTVMYEDHAHDRRQIASLTKLMTAMIVVERVKNLDEPVTISEDAVYADGTRVGCPRSGYCPGVRLKVGEQVRVRDLLKAALMNSANDAAIALGEHVGKTQTGFASLMNARARELGLKDTHFCTPSGLDMDGHETECYSSAYDIARITSHALKYDVIWQIMRLPETTITSVDGNYSHDIFNTDALLDQFPNLLGTKTGFTPMAGYSLLAVASDATKEHKVVAVVLDDPSRWQNIQTMFNWAFSSFVWK